MLKEFQLILLGYSAALTLALFIALSLRRERYWPPDPWDPCGDGWRHDHGCGAGLLVLFGLVAVFIAFAL